MGSDLQNALRSLCSNTKWKYSIFWKLKNRSRRVLTWEDAYYDNEMSTDSLECEVLRCSMGDYSQNDMLGFAVAKMSYQIYSLGEGIVGQVAATGKHRWIYADNVLTNSVQIFEPSDGLQCQFSAGIKTIAVVGVMPYGVVQIGSLVKVAEDIAFVRLIRDVFLSLQLSLQGQSLIHSYSSTSMTMASLPGTSRDSLFGCNEIRLDNQKQMGADLLQEKERGYSSLCGVDSISSCFSHRSGEETYLSCDASGGNARTSIMRLENDFAQILEDDNLMMFSGGYELHEALGPDFLRRVVLNERNTADDRNASGVTNNSASDRFVEAIVRNDAVSEKSVGKSVKPRLMVEEEPPESSKITTSNNALAKVKEDSHDCSNSAGICGVSSSIGASTCYSSFSQQQRADKREVGKGKKRSRPGENPRQRPRDRQLIQDRIKELRDLVPNGSKCSIDSLLEKTIKHMLFLESVTTYADKLNKCAESKRETGAYDGGSSWAVEVGGEFNVSSVVVESVNKSGEMLVEMVCEECSHFLEIAETVRGLGLRILKGVTERQADKTWICFVVEPRHDQTMHRMDVLWSLVRALQPKVSA